MRNNLTKKEIGWVPAKELNIRFCQLIEKGETLPVGAITIADAREILWIEDELHNRLIKLIGHDFYPPDIAKPTIAELKASIKASLIITAKATPQAKPKPVLKPVPKVVKPVEKTEGKLRFKIAIINSLGSTVKTQNVKVDSKGEADAEAHTMIKNLGLKKAKYKIS